MLQVVLCLMLAVCGEADDIVPPLMEVGLNLDKHALKRNDAN
jgi:hypothetical protein